MLAKPHVPIRGDLYAWPCDLSTCRTNPSLAQPLPREGPGQQRCEAVVSHDDAIVYSVLVKYLHTAGEDADALAFDPDQC